MFVGLCLSKCSPTLACCCAGQCEILCNLMGGPDCQLSKHYWTHRCCTSLFVCRMRSDAELRSVRSQRDGPAPSEACMPTRACGSGCPFLPSCAAARDVLTSRSSAKVPSPPVHMLKSEQGVQCFAQANLYLRWVFQTLDGHLATAGQHLIAGICSSLQQQSLPLKGPSYLLNSAAAVPGCLPLPKASLKLQ